MEKIVLITGASRGIGREIAKDLAKRGYKVIANYNKSENEALELKQISTNIDIYKSDVSKSSDVKNLVEYAIRAYGKIDILINNAGKSFIKLFNEITDEEWNDIINTNLYSAFAMSREVSKNMIKNHEGLIINISSIWGEIGASMETIYSISKAGMDGLTKSLAKELGPSNIRVNSIAPGIIDTKMNKNITEDDLKKIKDEIPLQKIGKKSDIVKVINWLIEDEYTTGQIISINGGWKI